MSVPDLVSKSIQQMSSGAKVAPEARSSDMEPLVPGMFMGV
jgi:hypothetical protein